MCTNTQRSGTVPYFPNDSCKICISMTWTGGQRAGFFYMGFRNITNEKSSNVIPFIKKAENYNISSCLQFNQGDGTVEKVTFHDFFLSFLQCIFKKKILGALLLEAICSITGGENTDFQAEDVNNQFYMYGLLIMPYVLFFISGKRRCFLYILEGMRQCMRRYM